MSLTGDCIVWAGAVSGSGYGHKKIPGTRMNITAHRDAWIRENGPIPKGLCVLHKCDNRKCINIDHLFLGTLADNTHDAQAKGRIPTAAHGGTAMYRRGCRCYQCTQANTDYYRGYRADRRVT